MQRHPFDAYLERLNVLAKLPHLIPVSDTALPRKLLAVNVSAFFHELTLDRASSEQIDYICMRTLLTSASPEISFVDHPDLGLDHFRYRCLRRVALHIKVLLANRGRSPTDCPHPSPAGSGR